MPGFVDTHGRSDPFRTETEEEWIGWGRGEVGVCGSEERREGNFSQDVK